MKPPSAYLFDFSLFLCLSVLASTSTTHAWSSLKEDAREDAYESLHARLKDADHALVRLKGVVTVQRSKREKVEKELDALVVWMAKLFEVIKGDPPSVSCFILVFGLCVSLLFCDSSY